MSHKQHRKKNIDEKLASRGYLIPITEPDVFYKDKKRKGTKIKLPRMEE